MLTGPWTGVEAYQPYVEEFDLKSKYEFLQVADIREIELFRNFGVIFLGDILEHMTAEQAYSVLEKARAVAEAKDQREPLCDLAEFYQIRGNWPACKFYAEAALRITDRQLLYTVDPTAWSFKPFDLLALAEYYLGNRKAASTYGNVALGFAPNDKRLKDNLDFYLEPEAKG
jgi:hypothetical protein